MFDSRSSFPAVTLVRWLFRTRMPVGGAWSADFLGRVCQSRIHPMFTQLGHFLIQVGHLLVQLEQLIIQLGHLLFKLGHLLSQLGHLFIQLGHLLIHMGTC